MDVVYPNRIWKRIKFYLVFFCLSLSVACQWGDQVHIQQVDFEDEKAVGVTFSTAMDVEKIRLFIGEESQTSVIGVIVSENDKHSFTPVIPFMPGQTYTLRKNNTEVLASFTIPEKKRVEAAELLAIYPKLDTVPENLLKMYFEFAQPMQEVGNALDFITVVNETDGLEEQPFLALESELWNKERTLLTLWLDPGRIKTDLVPNKERGLPIRTGKTYSVTIDQNWKSRRGVPLKQGYSKTFHVSKRDDQKPDLKNWQLHMEQSDPSRSLNIDFGEPMDAFLALETIQCFDKENKPIEGQLELLANQRNLRFTPDSIWPGPEIEIRAQSRLEDLAGNNLGRRFDRPISEGEIRDTDSSKILILTFKIGE